MDSSGDLRIGADAMIGRGAVLHCALSLTIGDQAVIAEYATVADSRHLRTPAGTNLLHHVTAAPTVVGPGVWVGAQAVVTSGVTIGAQAFIGAGAVVTKDVPPGWLAAGVPARAVRPLDTEDPGDAAP
jgi:acetyltransferase-like isoleucine patch superfamily enzyme